MLKIHKLVYSHKSTIVKLVWECDYLRPPPPQHIRGQIGAHEAAHCCGHPFGACCCGIGGGCCIGIIGICIIIGCCIGIAGAAHGGCAHGIGI